MKLARVPVPAWAYSRIANPTVGYVEETLALLESYGSGLEASAFLTSSGMSAVHMATAPFLDIRRGTRMNSWPARGATAARSCCSPSGTRRRGASMPAGSTDVGDIAAWEAAIDAETRFVYVETPSNPGLAVTDVEALAAVAHRNGLPLIVDSTVATPALLRPLALGADIVVHSVSKCLAASGGAIAGALVSRRDIGRRGAGRAPRRTSRRTQSFCQVGTTDLPLRRRRPFRCCTICGHYVDASTR